MHRPSAWFSARNASVSYQRLPFIGWGSAKNAGSIAPDTAEDADADEMELKPGAEAGLLDEGRRASSYMRARPSL